MNENSTLTKMKELINESYGVCINENLENL